MHYASMNSPRMQKTLAALSKYEWFSTRFISYATGSCCVSTDISELRRNGYPVDHRVISVTRTDGHSRAIHQYKLGD